MNDNNDDAAYFLARAEQEDKAARSAVSPLAAIIHRTLASRYRARAEAPDANDWQDLSVVRD